MPIKLVAPLIKDFILAESDEFFGNDGEPTTVTIRQATQDQNERRSQMISEVNQIMEADSVSDEIILRQNWSPESLRRTEVYLTMIDCNIADENDKPLFRFRDGRLDMSTSEFKVAWGKLPTLVAQEIHRKVLEVNITWAGPLGKRT